MQRRSQVKFGYGGRFLRTLASRAAPGFMFQPQEQSLETLTCPRHGLLFQASASHARSMFLR